MILNLDMNELLMISSMPCVGNPILKQAIKPCPTNHPPLSYPFTHQSAPDNL